MDCTLPSQDAWRRARDRYVEDLTDDERQRYDKASPETLLYDASAAQKEHEAKSRGRKVVENLQPLVSAIEQYGSALDVYSNAYPLVLSPLWGSIRIVLHLASEFNKYFDKIVDMFSRIGDVLPRFKVFERLFRNHERVVQALSVAYIDVIAFCSSAKDVFRRGQRTSKTTFKVAFKLIWKPFERQFEQQMASFRLHQKNVEKEAGLSHMIESADSRALVLANQMQVSKDKRLHDRIRIMALFPAIDHEAKHRQLVDLRHEGTGQWLLEHDSYVLWKGQQESAILCLYGIPGCGKSVLASAIIDDLAVSARPGTVDIVYFYCEYADQGTLRPINLLGTILKQLYAVQDIPEEIQEQILQAYAHGTRSPSTTELVSILKKLFTLRSRVVIVLDGLDECEKDAWREIVRALEGLVAAKPTVIQLFVTCVEESEVLRVLHRHPRIHASSSALAGDIESFVATSVQSRIDCGDLQFRDPGLQREIINELASKANGMFLWVYFQLNELCEALSDAMIRQILESLPDGLTNTYTRLLSKMSQGSLKTSLIQKLFKWIACARRPLRADEIKEAVAFEASDTSLDITKIPDEDLLVESCKGLVVRDPRDRTVRFAHHTIQQHLLSDMPDGSPDYFHFRLDEADAWVGTLCVSYLYFSDFETQVTKLPPKRRLEHEGLLESEGPLGIAGILGLSNSWLQIPYRLLGGKPAMKAPEIDYAEHLAVLSAPSTNTAVDLREKYKLLDYVISYWEPHTRHSLTTGFEKRTQDLAMFKVLPFDFRPWGENEHYGPYGCSSCATAFSAQRKNTQLPHTSLFNYATQVGNMVLLRSLFAQYHEHEGFETFLLACRHGQTEVVKYFMEHITYDISETRAVETAAKSGHLHLLQYLSDSVVFREHRAIYLGRCVYLAAESGHDAVVNYLCDRGFEVYNRDKVTGWHALEVAACNGYNTVVRTLLKAGNITESRWEFEGQESDEPDLMETTLALGLAAKNGHATVVRSLYELSTPDQTQRNRDGYTPLHKAAEGGHSAVVDALLENCGDTDKMVMLALRGGSEYPRRTASCLAAREGHVGVLEVLQRHGLSLERPSDKRSSHKRSKTEIEEAAQQGHDAVVRWLIDHGANVNANSDIHPGPLYYTARWGNDATVRLLLDYGAIIRDPSPFEIAAISGSIEVLKTLLLYTGKVHREKVRAVAEDALKGLQDEGRKIAASRLKSVLEANP